MNFIKKEYLKELTEFFDSDKNLEKNSSYLLASLAVSLNKEFGISTFSKEVIDLENFIHSFEKVEKIKKGATPPYYGVKLILQIKSNKFLTKEFLELAKFWLCLLGFYLGFEKLAILLKVADLEPLMTHEILRKYINIKKDYA